MAIDQRLNLGKGLRNLYREDDPYNSPLETARQAFLNAYQKHQPAVLESLRRIEEVFSGEGAGRQEDLWDKIRFSPNFPRLTISLVEWAYTHYFIFRGEPASWVMEAALATLSVWSESAESRAKSNWHFPLHLHEEFPSSDPDYVSTSTGISDNGMFEIQLAVAPWDIPGGESEDQFRQRFNAVYKQEREEYIQNMKHQHWSTRRPLERSEYIESLAIWQVRLSLAAVRHHLASQGVHVGSDSDLSSITRGLNRAAGWIQIDRRKIGPTYV